MPALIRPNRIDVTDRYPMLAFTLHSGEGPRLAEVVLLTDLVLLNKREARNTGNFYSSREGGVLTIPASGSIYTVPPQVLARFIGAERLFFALATASAPGGQDWRVDVMPSAASPFVSLRGLSDRALRRVRMYPAAVRTRSGVAPAPVATWTGDLPPAAGSVPTAAPSAEPAALLPAVPYNDGFGPLPPLNTAAQPAPAEPAAAPPTVPAAQGLSDEEDERSIDGPVLDEPQPAISAGLGSPSPLTIADYPGARLMPSPAWSSRRGTAIDRIVIHITSAPQSPYIGSHFARPDANSSAHYMVDQNGAIIQFVREQDKAWHAGSANRRSIGIEHVAVERGGATYGTRTFPYTPPTEAELNASAQLVAQLCSKYGLTPDRTTILGHHEADPSTSHTSCPDGAWDWADYMPRVAAAYAALAPTGVSAAPPSSAGQGLALAMAAGDVTVGAERQPISLPSASAASSVTGRVVEAAISAVFPPLAALRLAVEASGLTIGVGPAVSAGLLAGGALGVGIILAPGNVIGVYGAAELDAGLISSIGAQMQLTIVSGGIASFNGVGYCAGVSGGEVYTGGAAALFDASRNFCGVTLSIGVGVGLAPVDIYTGVQRSVATTLALAQSRSLGEGGTDTVEIKYRAFIPSPLIKGPASDYDLPFGIASGEDFGGDNRSFQYSGGTSRGEITALVDVLPNGTLQNLRIVDRQWSPSSAYDSTYTYHVEGKPDWWMDKQAGHTPSRRATLPVSDDNLNIQLGGVGIIGAATEAIARQQGASLMTLTMAGALPLISPSPDINADINILIRRKADGTAEVKAYGKHDGFPAHELYINRQQAYTYDPVAAGNGPGSLMPPEDIDLVTSWVTVSGGAAAQGLGLPQSHAMIIDSDDVGKINRLRAGDFRDLFQWEVPQTIKARVDARGYQIQTIDAAVGDLNLDFYKVRIDRFPPGLDGPALLSRFIQDTNSFLDSSICSFDPFTPADAITRALTDPVGTFLKLTMIDDAAIVISDKGPHGAPTQFYAVTTLHTPDTGDHPVSGHRQFGYMVENGVTYFYTRGADRATLAFPGTEGLIYSGGESLWQSFQRTTAAYINNTGGSATIVTPFSERFNPGATRAMFGFTQALSQSLGADDWTINWDELESIAQPTDMACWATSAAMVTGWRDRQSVDPSLIARYNGLAPSLQTGLSAADTARFVPAVGMQFAPAACYTPEGFRSLLEQYGPLFIVAQVPGLHAIVVTGMYLKDGQYFVRITDPWDRVVGAPGTPGAYANTHTTGSRYIMSYDAFAAEYEAAAGFGTNQIAHGGAVSGREPNRGSAVGAGYALALDKPAAPIGSPVPAEPVTTRTTSNEGGRSYDLAQLAGMVRPTNALAGGAGMTPIAGERVTLDDWPYIEEDGQRTQANVTIDWKFDSAAVGDIVITPAGGSVASGRTVAVRADIVPGTGTPDRTVMLVRVTTTFSKPGEADQSAVNEVVLGGDGRATRTHCPPEAASPPPASQSPSSETPPAVPQQPAAAAQPVMA